MTEVLQSPSHYPSSPTTNTALFQTQSTHSFTASPNPATTSSNSPVVVAVESPQQQQQQQVRADCGVGGSDRDKTDNSNNNNNNNNKIRTDKEGEEISLLTVLVAVFRKSLVACTASNNTTDELSSAMDIGWPTNVRHVAHVTYDRFDGFLGLPVEFQPEVPTRAPSASTSAFGVSTESMQLSFDSRGNCVPTILLLMQRQLYTHGGLQAEGIFRINAENSREELVRDQLNRGIIPDDIDVHSLAGLIKAWFRELPSGVLDPLSPEQIMQCDSEEECSELAKLLPSTEASLLNWVINLMVDVVQEEQFNKMNAHNIAMVFAPNMTQMVDPLTALMYTVQVMNFLKTLVMKALREREGSQIHPGPIACAGPSDESGHESPSQPPPCLEDYLADDDKNDDESEHYSIDDPAFDSPRSHYSSASEDYTDDSPFQWDPFSIKEEKTEVCSSSEEEENQFPGQSSNGDTGSKRKEHVNSHGELLRTVTVPVTEVKGVCSLTRVRTAVERVESWR